MGWEAERPEELSAYLAALGKWEELQHAWGDLAETNAIESPIRQAESDYFDADVRLFLLELKDPRAVGVYVDLLEDTVLVVRESMTEFDRSKRRDVLALRPRAARVLLELDDPAASSVRILAFEVLETESYVVLVSFTDQWGRDTATVLQDMDELIIARRFRTFSDANNNLIDREVTISEATGDTILVMETDNHGQPARNAHLCLALAGDIVVKDGQPVLVAAQENPRYPTRWNYRAAPRRTTKVYACTDCQVEMQEYGCRYLW